MRILMVAAEFAPLAKTGGLGDMLAGLSGWLARQGHDVRVLLPRYGLLATAASTATISSRADGPVRVDGTHPGYSLHWLDGPATSPRIYLLDAPALYGSGPIYGQGDRDALRFALLAHAAIELCSRLDWQPDIVHAHDWHAALLPLLLHGPAARRNGLDDARSLLSIHNIGYQGDFPLALASDCGIAPLTEELDPASRSSGRLNFLLTGIQQADALSTVSPEHAAEILTPVYGMGLEAALQGRREQLYGILNGVDYACWDPAHDPLIAERYSADDPAGKARCRAALLDELKLLPGDGPLLAMVSRLASQKGIDLLIELLPELLQQQEPRVAILGSGEPAHEAALNELMAAFPGRLAFISAQDEGLAHRIFAAADIFLVPSRYEPCGLTQLYALRYGAIPVVRATGGLKDTVTHFDPATGLGNGSVFLDADSGGLRWGISQALAWYQDQALFSGLRQNAMRADFSWDRQGPQYVALYERMAHQQ